MLPLPKIARQDSRRSCWVFNNVPQYCCFKRKREVGNVHGWQILDLSSATERNILSPLHSGAEPLTDGGDGRRRRLAYPSQRLLNTHYRFFILGNFFFSFSPRRLIFNWRSSGSGNGEVKSSSSSAEHRGVTPHIKGHPGNQRGH